MRLAGWASPDLSSRTWITRSLGASPSSTSRTPRCRRFIPITATLNQSEDYSERKFYGSFVRAPVRSDPIPRQPRLCGVCDGSQLVACRECSGSGRLPRGGYHKKNHINTARIVESKWTAMERTFGWRHFRVTQKRREGKETFVLMVSTCDESSQFWLNIKNLKERERWASGWLQKAEIAAATPAVQMDGGANKAGAAGPQCKACSGSGSIPCPVCSMAGQVVEL